MTEPEIFVGDITTLKVDAIVNAANAALGPGGGVCGAIHDAAGPQLADACAHFDECATGDARVTPGFDLPAKIVIHTVGPVYAGGGQDETELLASCYRRSLELAEQNGAASIAFPCISTGVYGYPLEEAATVALTEIQAWRKAGRQPERIICCCFTEVDAQTYRNRMASMSG